jgi:hypothetical protein
MLLTIVLLLLQQPSASPRLCPDLSGHYVLQGEDGHVDVIIEQTGCERLALEWNIFSYPDTAPSRHVLRLDGRFHPDTGWFGSPGSQLTSARFIGDTLHLVAKASNASRARSLPWEQSFVTIGDDLCTRFVDSSGSRSATMATRAPSTDGRTKKTRGRLRKCV